jgi:hypothetical protein
MEEISMSGEVRSSITQDSLPGALGSEISAAGDRLGNWIRQVHLRGASDILFCLETWLRGIESFLDLQHLPLSEAEKAELTTRSFVPEIRILRRAIQISEGYACALISPEVAGAFTIEEFIRGEIRRERLMNLDEGHLVEQVTPADSLAQLLDSLNDLRVTIDALDVQSGLGCGLFLSLGRIYRREIKNCRYIELLLKQESRLQSSVIENQSLAGPLRNIPDDSVRRDIVQVLADLFQFLKYLKLVRSDLVADYPLKHDLVIFSLLHQETIRLSEFIRSRLLRRRDANPALRTAAELVAYSMKEESQRVLNRELPFVAGEIEPSRVYTRIENSDGLLRNCCESCVLTLLQAIDGSFDAASLFPTRAERLLSSEKLRKDLWELRQWLMEMLESGEQPDSNRIVERFVSFKEASQTSLMYRDWEDFEAFLDAVTSSNNPPENRMHIRKFTGYLEMLIQEVSKRSVFQERKS